MQWIFRKVREGCVRGIGFYQSGQSFISQVRISRRSSDVCVSSFINIHHHCYHHRHHNHNHLQTSGTITSSIAPVLQDPKKMEEIFKKRFGNNNLNKNNQDNKDKGRQHQRRKESDKGWQILAEIANRMSTIAHVPIEHMEVP